MATEERPPMIIDSPEEVLSTMRADGKRRWLYPVLSVGKFWKSRRVIAWTLIVLFTALPLLKINGKPSIFIDIMRREFTFFGLTLYSTDTVLWMLFLLTVLLTVFFGTALLGRVWCGWACPQTVYLEFIFRPIERLIEGKEGKRKRRDEGPLNFDKAWRKVAKHSIYIAIALLLAHTFVAYFVSWDQLRVWMTGSPKENWAFFVMMAITTGMVYFDFAFFREQMCTITCPYARFQSVLIDSDSMIVSYDPNRGEPRGRRNRKQRKQEREGVRLDLGDCIDCGACVRTCPTGIDIRDGLQMECIGCTQCMDACDAIMISIDKPVGLIRYTSENAIEQKPTRPVRPRTVLYGLALLALASAFVFVLVGRSTLDVNIGRVVNVPYMQMGDGIGNNLRFRLQDRMQDSEVDIVAIEPEGAEVRVIGQTPLQLQRGRHKRVESYVIVPKEAFTNGSVQGVFEIRADDGRTQRAKFNLLGPSNNGDSP